MTYQSRWPTSCRPPHLQAHCSAEKANEFCGQFVHEALPAAEMEAPPHGVHTVAPGFGENVPGGHNSHDFMELFLNVPGTQRQSSRNAEAFFRDAVLLGHC